MNKTEFTNLVVDVNQRYKKCWAILITLKTAPEPALGDFQYLLSDALSLLSEKHSKIKQIQRTLINNKHRYKKTWFSKRLKQLANYDEIIKILVAIGKTMGDGFAWFFYHQSSVLLEHHLKQPENKFLPTGLGGIGEKAIIKDQKFINGQMILYHGITSILRAGDISLVDLKNLSISGIGELKTKRIDEKTINVTGNIISPLNAETTKQLNLSQSRNSRPVTLDKQIAARLLKQTRNIASIVSAAEKTKIDQRFDMLRNSSVYNQLDFLKGIGRSEVRYKKIGSGVMLVGYREKSGSELTKLLNNANANYGKIFEEVTDHAKTILVENSTDNNLFMSTILYPDNEIRSHLLGMIPVFWWPTDPDVLRMLILREIFLFSLFNPAPFIGLLRKKGFAVLVKYKPQFKIEIHKIGNGKKIELEGIGYFLKLMSDNFHSEEDVVDYISKCVAEIEKLGTNQNMRVELRFDQYMDAFRKP